MSALVIEGEAGLRDHLGRELGESAWREIPQATIDGFAALTGDDQWIHVDVERARSGPFGTTIAHGFLTLALLPELSADVYRVDGFAMAINYGLNRVRFPSPVPAGARVRASFRLDDVTSVGDAVQAEYRMTITAEGAAKPACVADFVSRYYP
jgi:acyl dehydratase